MLICQSCYFDEHKTHDAIEIKKEEKKKLKDLHEKLESAAEKLQLRKEKIFATKTEVAEKNKICLKTLNETKKKILKAVEVQMDELMKDATNQISEVNKQFDDDLNNIEELLTEVENLTEIARSQSVTYDDLVDKLKEIHEIEIKINKDLSGHRIYYNTSFTSKSTTENIKKLCGNLARNENQIFLQNGEYCVVLVL